MIQTILQTIPILALAFLLYMYFIQQNEIKAFNLKVSDLEKQLKNNENLVKSTTSNFRKLDDKVTSVKFTYLNEFEKVDKKIADLYDRWDIISHEYITSIPETVKDWHDAKLIILQPKPKIWKPKNLSQSKSSVVNAGGSYVEEEEEINQDFSVIDDELLDSILDEEDTDTSSATDNNQSKKPKPKKKSNQMKM
jgi:hypothetical protein